MQLPLDNSKTFPGIPLKGHLCALKRGGQKYYWHVEKLKRLPIGQSNVKELIEKIGNGTWFGPEEKPTIKAFLIHVERALKADLSFPLLISSDGKVLDGSHRLMAAYIKGIETLPTVKFEREPEPDYVEEIGF